MSLSISTVPADADPQSVQTARRIRNWLEMAGVRAEIDLLSDEEFWRAVLINHDFDLFVGPYPIDPDPDALYGALHSQFAEEIGWQNPFGLTSMAFDDLLAEQRERSGHRRQESIERVLETAVDEQPFVPICIPESYRLVREDRIDGWSDRYPDGRIGVLDLSVEPGGGTDDAGGNEDELRAIITDTRPTSNLNPLAAEHVYRETFVDLVYDSLGTVGASVPDDRGDEDGVEPGDKDGTEPEAGSGGEDGDGTTGESDQRADDATAEPDADEVTPWLAESWTWADETMGPIATVTLREATWHDGEPVTAGDIAFTYELLHDTTHGNDVRSPAPRYRGVSAAVDAVSVVDDRTIAIHANAAPTITERAFTVPILPEHVWSERTEPASVPGIDVPAGTTAVVIDDNVPPIGSGPFEFAEATEREQLRLERVRDHFAWNDETLPDPPADAIVFGVQPNNSSAIEAIEQGAADCMLSPLEPEHIGPASEYTGSTIALRNTTSRSVYCLGFNIRNAPLSNPYFRRAVASVVDKEFLVEEVFGGYARPVAAPAHEPFVPESLQWDGEDPVVPFCGEDGTLDAPEARRSFENAGYRYNENDELLIRS